MRGRTWCVVAMILIGGCTRHGPVAAKLEVDDEVAGADADDSKAERERLAREVERVASSGARVGEHRSAAAVDESRALTYEGIFDIDRVVGGKSLQGSWLETRDGHRYVLSYRPMPEHFDKVEKRVVVRGVTYVPDGQHLLADHMHVVSMRLADGEVPVEPPPTSLPSPPQVRTRAELRARVGRWVQAVGTLKGAGRPDRNGWRKVELRLDDGAVVATTESESTVEREYRPKFGARVTWIGELREEGGELLLDSVEMCAGEVDDCGAR